MRRVTMPTTVRLRDAAEYSEAAQKMFELSRAWFNYDFSEPPAMSRVMAWDPAFGGPHGRAMKRAMAPGEFSRAEKEMVAAVVRAATRRAFVDNRLTRRLKEALAFAVSVTSRSPFGTTFHLGEMRRLGVGERGVMEVLGVTQMFSSYTKIADTLQLESDMHDLAPVDWSPAPGGPPTPHAPKA